MATNINEILEKTSEIINQKNLEADQEENNSQTSSDVENFKDIDENNSQIEEDKKNIDFQNSFEMDLDRYFDWYKNPVSAYGKRQVVITNVCNILGFLISIALVVIGIYKKQYIILAIGGLFTLKYIFDMVQNEKKRLNKQFEMVKKTRENVEGKWIRVTNFYDDEFEIVDSESVTKFQYSTVTEFIENDQYYNVVVNKKTAVRVLKNAFIAGDEEDFKDYLFSRINQEAIPKEQ